MKKALEAALGQIERAFGKGSMMKLGHQQALDIEAISTGSLGLDIAPWYWWLAQRKVIEIFGPESSGKDHIGLTLCCRSAKKRRDLRLH